MRQGDKIRLQRYIFGVPCNLADYTVEEFRDCLGIFESPQHRLAERFTPLCDLYEAGPESENLYIQNFGEYISRKVPMFMNITEIVHDGYNQF